ncbi:MAG: hypothetical protein AB1758_15555 [Candidatus Eremiobacterota bacterium]
MRRLIFFLLLAAMVHPSVAAPLQEPSDRQAQEAVKLLQAWGLVEGYPGGAFRGERAMTRWEVAMLVARAMARLESQHGQFASRAQREEVQRLTESFREELAALGVRVDNLERQVERLDKRVEQVGRIEWEGRLVTRVLAQAFSSTGNATSGTPPGNLNYATLVGTSAGGNLRPHGPPGVLPVIDLVRGRPLTDGQSFTSFLNLTANINASEDLTAKLRLWAYTAQGDAEVDAVWGVTPPYLANSFTGRPFTGGAVDGASQGLPHFPFTSAGLDQVQVTCIPAALTLTLGAYRPRLVSPTVYQGQVNPQPGDPRVLESFGFHVTGESEPCTWEVFSTRLPDGNPGVTAPYTSDALGASLNFSRDAWTVGLSYLKAANHKPSDSGPTTAGQIFTFVQGLTGEFYTDWVNPPGFFVNQLGGPFSPNVAGAGSSTDVRPVNGLLGFDGLTSRATFGPQAVSLVGLNVQWEEDNWAVFGDYAHSDYQPSTLSRYGVAGDLFRIAVQTRQLEDALELALEYRHTDPTYDPFILTFPGTAAGQRIFRVYHRLPDFDQFWHMWSLHNTDDFPHNRRGVWARARWQYDPDGSLMVRYRRLEQVRTSLQDVRVPADSLGPATPMTAVLGHSPGFFDVVFREYSTLSFTRALQPLEDRRGVVNGFTFDLNQVFTGSPWRLEGMFDRWSFQRPSTLAPAQGGSQNRVDLVAQQFRLAVGHSFGDDVLVRLGYEQGRIRGHYDPFGNYNRFAIASGSTAFTNWDTLQHVPHLSVDWQVSEGVRANALLRYYDTVDRASPAVFSGRPGGPGATVHPFSWNGYQVGTTLEVSF